MRGSSNTDVVHSNSEDQPAAARPDSPAPAPTWVDRLIRGVDEAEQSKEFDDPVFRLEHVQGPPATAARIHGAIGRAIAALDGAMEREACWKLAVHLASQGIDFPSVIRSARRAMELGGDDGQRGQLAVWLESIGDLVGAAEVLRPSVARARSAKDAARLLARIARLLVRADRPQMALEALLQASAVWPGSAEALDTAGELAASMSLSEGAAMLLESADRHEARGDKAGAFEARRRAFDLAPAARQPAEALVASLDRANRWDAADGVLRSHAAASAEEQRSDTQRQRFVRAMERGQTSTAVAAVVDGRFESAVDDPAAAAVDELLESAGLHDLLAIRWMLRARRGPGADRAAAWTALAALFMGRLASPDRALDAWIEVLTSDPTNAQALSVLRTHARTMHDPTPLAEGLLRAAIASPDPGTAIECLRELASIAEERLADPSLASWAYEGIVQRGGAGDDIDAARQRLTPRVRLQDGALGSAREVLSSSPSPDARTEALRRISSILRGRPADVDEYLNSLRELVESGQSERRWWVDFERVARRTRRFDLLEAVIRERLAADVSRADRVHYRMTLVEARVETGDERGALDELRALTREVPGVRPAGAFAWAIASMLGDDEARAEAMEQVASSLAPSLRASLFATAGELRMSLGQDSEATRLAELARRTDPNAPRVVWFLASIALRTQDPSYGAAIEKVWSVFIPEGAHHEALANAFERVGDYATVHIWTRRWHDLRPWDVNVVRRLVGAATSLGKAEPLVDALTRVLSGVHSFDVLAPVLETGLRALAAIDLDRAISLAKALLERGAVRVDALRALLIDVAWRASQVAFEVEVLERGQVEGDAPSNGAELLRIAELRRQAQDSDGEASALARAAGSPEHAMAVMSRLESASQPDSGDAIIWTLEAQARAMTALGASPSEQAARTWLRAGAARWDLGGDRNGALDAWRNAASILGDRTYARLGAALSRFAGDGAAAALGEYAARIASDDDAGAMLVVAAALAVRAGRPDATLRLATQALERTPTRTEALLLVERASKGPDDVAAIDKAYALVAKAAKGRFGRRAAHYRAARTLESQGHFELAIVHAMAAFEADPVDGAVLTLMMRLSERLEPTDVIQTLARVADGSQDAETKAFWLRSAARLAAKQPAHARSAIDLGLRALLQSPSGEAVEILGRAMEVLLSDQPDEADILRMRLERAARAIVAHLEGPRGARVAIDLAKLAADTLDAPDLAWAWLNAAFACSGDIDEYAILEPAAPKLARDVQRAAGFLDAVLERVRGFGGTTGTGLFALAAAVASSMEDTERSQAIQDALRAAAAATEADSASVEGFGDLLVDDAPQVEPAPSTQRGLTPSKPVASVPQAAPSEPKEELDALRRASNLETIGELASAVEVLEAELRNNPARQPEIDAHLRRLYAASGRNSKLALVLDRLAERAADPGDKLRLLVEMASLMEAREDLAGTRAAWERVADIDPANAEAAAFLEREAVEAGDYEKLSTLLRRRADASVEPTDKRMLRLRRAMLFEHRLRRPNDAARELDDLLSELGEDVTVLRARADLAAGTGDDRGAAQTWLRAARIAVAPTDAAAFACKSAALFLKMGHERAARDALMLAGPVRSPEVLSLLVELERSSGNQAAMGAALDDLATASHEPDKTRAGWLMDAADVAVSTNHVEIAMERAARAERLAPEDARIVLRRVLVEYRVAGLGNRGLVASMLARLESVAERVGDLDWGLHSFLTAEVVEALSGRDPAYRLLAERQQRAPSDPLIALGLAERLTAGGHPGSALPLFDIALASGDLGGLRTRAQVAFAAARAALNAGGPVVAAPYIAEVERHPEATELAERLRREAAEPTEVNDEMRRQLERVARESMGVERARALRQIARTWAARGTRAALAEADAYYAEAGAAAASDPLIKAQIDAERAAFHDRSTVSERPPALRAGTSTPPTHSYPPIAMAAAGGVDIAPTTVSYPPQAQERPRASEPPPTKSYPPPPPGPTTRPTPPDALGVQMGHGERGVEPGPKTVPALLAPAVAFGRASELPPPRERSVSGPSYSIVEPRTPRSVRAPIADTAEEKKLYQQLSQGDVTAGDRLAGLLEADPGRAHDLVAVRRRQVVLEPTNVRLLGVLRDAALADHDRAHALAVEHVIDVLSGSLNPVRAPDQPQPEDAERLHSMLSRGVHTESTEIFAHVWENAPHVFARDPAAFGVTGLERVVMGAPTPVGRTYATAARALGLSRTPVFQKRTAGAQGLAVALLQTPAVVVTGEVHEETPELLYRISSMLAGTLPANVMLFGMTGTAITQLMQALMAAFGPPEASRGRESESAILAGELWRALPGRVQRRMQQILRESTFAYEEVWARALQSSRRAGFFVVGDLRVALYDVMGDPGVRQRIDLASADALRSLCQLSTSAADLIRFATSVEYAQARWRDDMPRRSLSGPGR